MVPHLALRSNICSIIKFFENYCHRTAHFRIYPSGFIRYDFGIDNKEQAPSY